jgi:serine/threonine protein kinase
MAWQGFKIIGKLGEGGMATVYKGIQESLQRPVAIKILAANLKDHPEILARFESESLIIAQLNHPHIIHVIDKGVTSKGRPYFVMEFVEGMTLEEAINLGKLDLPRKLDVLVQICKALGYAHKNGVIHRDIKPGNILIDPESQVRVVDFGIAHFYDAAKAGGLLVESSEIMGTSAYMAPELLQSAEAASIRSDLFALGIVMYELFTGVQPQGDIPPPTQFEPDLPAELSSIILKCLEENPDDRPKSADEVKNSLLHLARGSHLSKDQKDRAVKEQPVMEGKFELLDVLKEDHFSRVYLYEDAARKKLMAVKKLPAGVQGLKEQKLLSRLQHNGLIQILGISNDDVQTTIITEYLSGGSLAEQMLSPIDPHKVFDWGKQIAEALSFAHRNRIFHGNLRPSNILFDGLGAVKITDFALKPHYSNKEEQNWYKHPALQNAALDIFSLGAILYHALTGREPQFRNGKLMRSKVFADQHPRVQEVVSRLLESVDERRYPTTEVVVAELRGVLRQLEDQFEEQRKVELQRKVSEVIKREEKGSADPLPWKKWIFRLGLVLLIVEELWLGIGWKSLRPLLEPYMDTAIDRVKANESYIEWSDKTRRVIE